MRYLLSYRLVFVAVILSFVVSCSSASGPHVPAPARPLAEDYLVECCDLEAMPTQITLERGDSITITEQFSQDISLYEPYYLIRATTKDGRTGDVVKLELHLVRLDPNTIQIAYASSLRDGQADIEFVPPFGSRVAHTIEVVVR